MSSDIAREIENLAEDFGIDKKRSIGDVAHELGVEAHVIRFWEEQFPQIKPEIGKGGRRYYYNKQFKVLKRIKKFLHDDGYTIAGLQKLLKKRKQDSHKEEDIDIILAAGFSDAEKHSAHHEDGGSATGHNFMEDLAQAAAILESEGAADVFVDLSFAPSKSLNSLSTSNLADYPPQNYSLSKEQREELKVIFRNITKNLGDLKVLLRS